MVESLLGVKKLGIKPLRIKPLRIYILTLVRVEANRRVLVKCAEIRVKVIGLVDSLVLNCESSVIGRVEVKAC